MCYLYLVRHGAHDWLDRGMPGRTPGVHLNAEGQAQAERLVQIFREVPLAALYASPLERTRETAAPLSRATGLPVRVDDRALEVDFGEWTAATFAVLEADPRWDQFNAFRSGFRIPGGEVMTGIQARMLELTEQIRQEHPKGHVVLFGHGDPLKTVILWALGMPLDMIRRLEIAPASVTTLRLEEGSVHVLGVGQRESIPR